MIFNNIFGCKSSDKKREQNEEITDLKERVNRLELQYIGLKDILLEIKTDIKLLHIELRNAHIANRRRISYDP